MKIETKNLTKNYIVPKSGEVKVLKGIDLLINSGEKVALMGPSGAGKSTLIHILGLMDKPTSGNVFIDDIDITSFTQTKLAKMRKENIGFVFQFHYLLAPLFPTYLMHILFFVFYYPIPASIYFP